WFVLAIAPYYKIFASQMDTDIGSRHAYLSTAPLSVFLTYGIATFSVESSLPWLFRILSLITLGLCALVLYINNLVWAEAGNWTNNLVKELIVQSRKMKDRQLVYVLALPSSDPKGIYCVGSLWWMTQKPFLDKDMRNIMRIEEEFYISSASIKQA